MADILLSQLSTANQILPSAMFLIEQGGVGQKITWQMLTNWLVGYADGHGGIQGIAFDSSSGSNPVVDTYKITYADGMYNTFTVTNGVKGDPGPAATVSDGSPQYVQTQDATTVPSVGWQSTVPTLTPGYYLWTRKKIIFNGGTDSESYAYMYSVARQGIDGNGAVNTVNGISPDGAGEVTLTPSDIGAASLTDGKVTPSEASSALVTKTASFTIDATFSGRMVLANSSSTIEITVPNALSVLFPTGTEIEFVRIGSGAVSFFGASGVTLRSLDNATSISGQYGVAALKKIGADEWLLAGALE